MTDLPTARDIEQAAEQLVAEEIRHRRQADHDRAAEQPRATPWKRLCGRLGIRTSRQD